LALQLALAQLGQRGTSPACEQARASLRLAIVELRTSR
jgi:hypothetical protein